jgi:cytochrome d ubiquinol oxidase subunit I
MAMLPSGFIAVLTGWMTAEVGRQPWVVYGLLRTADAASPIAGGSVAFSLTLFVLVYGIVFGFGTYYLIKLLMQGPEDVEPDEGEHDIARKPKRPFSKPSDPADKAGGAERPSPAE